MSPDARYGEPPPLVVAGVVHLFESMANADFVDGTLRTRLLVPDIAEHARLSDLDKTIIRHLPELTRVCWRPHDRLGVEHVLVRASQARRVPVEGLQRLASHSEEWAGVEFGRIVPEHLLTVRYVDDFDFYENRIAAQLVDRLRRYLGERISDLRVLTRHLSDLDRYGAALEGAQSYRKRERLAYLLAEAAEGDGRKNGQVAETLARLTKLAAEVNRLRNSPVYRRANRRSRIPYRLPRTNLLLSDHKYQRTALLWEAWALRDAKRSEDVKRQLHDFRPAYGAYVLAVVLRAFEVLGFKAVNAAPGGLGGPVDVEDGHGTRIQLRHDEDERIVAWYDGAAIAALIPHCGDLTADPSPAKVQQALQELARETRSDSVSTVVAYPGDHSERLALPKQLRQRVHWTGRFATEDGAPRRLTGTVPVSPLEIESTERMARALRWIWHTTVLQPLFPPRIEADSWLRLEPRPSLREEDRGWHLAKPLGAEESRELRNEIRHRFAAHTARSRSAPRESVEEVLARVDTAERALRLLQNCPLCPETEPEAFEGRDSTYHCRCECGAQWGTRTCGTCKERFPVLWTSRTFEIGLADLHDGDAIDATLGSEALALPCPSSADRPRFKCPWCGTCPGAPMCGCEVEPSQLSSCGPFGAAPAAMPVRLWAWVAQAVPGVGGFAGSFDALAAPTVRV